MYALSILFCQYFSQEEFSAKLLVYAMATAVAMNFFLVGGFKGYYLPLKGSNVNMEDINLTDWGKRNGNQE